jgi:error-prone DNA polymerase
MRSRKPLQDTMTAIRIGKPVAECGYALAQNAEQHLRPRVQLANLYPPARWPKRCASQECTFNLEQLRYEYPHELIPAGHTPASYLRQEVEKGLLERWPGGAPEKVRTQIEAELALIADLKYEPIS